MKTISKTLNLVLGSSNRLVLYKIQTKLKCGFQDIAALGLEAPMYFFQLINPYT